MYIRVSYRIFFWGGGGWEEVIVVTCVSTPAHVSTCVPPRGGGGGGGVWGYAPRKFWFLDLRLLLTQSWTKFLTILFDDTYQMTKHHTKFQDFWGGGGGLGGIFQGPPSVWNPVHIYSYLHIVSDQGWTTVKIQYIYHPTAYPCTLYPYIYFRLNICKLHKLQTRPHRLWTVYTYKWLVFYCWPGHIYDEVICTAVPPDVQSQTWPQWLDLMYSACTCVATCMAKLWL